MTVELGSRERPGNQSDVVFRVRDMSVSAASPSNPLFETPLVEDVSLDVNRGEVLAIVGESGAGKTMTARAWLGLLPSGVRASGKISVAGSDCDLDDGAALAGLRGPGLAFVMQNPVGSLDPLQRIGAQMVEAVCRRRILTRDDARERARQLLERMGFDDAERVWRLFPHELSGGMAQRICIAIALMPRPAVLMADEPTSALDANLRTEALSLIREAAIDQGTSVVIISHDLALVGKFCDRVIVMYGGHVLEDGLTSAVLSEPQHPYTASLLTCAPTLEAPSRSHVPAIEGVPPRPGAWEQGCLFAPRCPLATDDCRTRRPHLLPAASGSRVACHFPGGDDR